MNLRKALLSLVLVMAAAMAGFGAVETLRTVAFVAQAQPAQGAVVGWKNRSIRSGTLSEQSTRFPIIRFESAGGQVVEFVSSIGFQGGGYRLNQAVAVLYAPNDPSRARIDSFVGLWLFSAGFLGIGVFALWVVARNWRGPPAPRTAS
jgi:hypothetical protein